MCCEFAVALFFSFATKSRKICSLAGHHLTDFLAPLSTTPLDGSASPSTKCHTINSKPLATSKLIHRFLEDRFTACSFPETEPCRPRIVLPRHALCFANSKHDPRNRRPTTVPVDRHRGRERHPVPRPFHLVLHRNHLVMYASLPMA